MKLMASIALLAVAIVVAGAGYMMFRPPAEATGPIEAAPVTQEPGSTPASATVYVIDPDASSARFVIDEILRGEPTTVVGTTNQVAGQIAADLNNLNAAQVGEIRVNARTLTTDANGRNRMLKNQILLTDEHEFITFTPTRMEGLPENVTVGQSFTFQMVGNLAIRGTAREATFDVSVTPTAQDRLEGTASTTINYADWGVTIPQVPSVAGVDEDVALHLDFVATSA